MRRWLVGIKHEKLNKVRQSFTIATKSNNSKKTLCVLSVPYYKLYVFCPYILFITSPNPNMLSVPPCIAYILSVPLMYCLSAPLKYCLTLLLHTVHTLYNCTVQTQ